MLGNVQQIDNRCRHSPRVDGARIHCSGGSGSGGLYRRRKDGSGDAQQFDNNCLHAPYVEGDHVYFAGGASGLCRRKNDGSSPEAENLGDWCGAGPVIAGEHVYYLGTQGMNVLCRRLKDGLGASEPLDPNGAFQPCIDGQTIHWAGGPNRRSLYMGNLLKLQQDAYREWTRDRWATIQALPLWQAVLPGSHDSGCCGNRVFAGHIGYSVLTSLRAADCAGRPCRRAAPVRHPCLRPVVGRHRQRRRRDTGPSLGWQRRGCLQDHARPDLPEPRERAGTAHRPPAAESVPLVTSWLDDDAAWGAGAWNIVAADLLTETEYLELVRAIINRNGQHRY